MLAGRARRLFTPLLVLIPSVVLIGSLAVYIHSSGKNEPQDPSALPPQQQPDDDKERRSHRSKFASAPVRIANAQSAIAGEVFKNSRNITKVAATASDGEAPRLEQDGANGAANDLLELFKQTLHALVSEKAKLEQDVAELRAALRDSRDALAAANQKYDAEKQQRALADEKHKNATAAAKMDAERAAARYQEILAKHQAAQKAVERVKQLEAELQQSRRQQATTNKLLENQLKQKDQRIAKLEALSNAIKKDSDALKQRHQELRTEFQTAVDERQRAKTALSDTDKRPLRVESSDKQRLAAPDEKRTPSKPLEAVQVKQLETELRHSREQLVAAKTRHDEQLKQKVQRIVELEALSHTAEKDAAAVKQQHQKLRTDLQAAVAERKRAETALGDANNELSALRKKHQQVLAALDKELQPKKAREAALARKRLKEQVREFVRQQAAATQVASNKLNAFDLDAGNAAAVLSTASEERGRAAGALDKVNQDWDGILQSASDFSKGFDAAHAELETNTALLASRAEVVERSRDSIQKERSELDPITSQISDLQKTKRSILSRVNDLLGVSGQVRRLSELAAAKASALDTEIVGLGQTARGDGGPGATPVALSYWAFEQAQADMAKTAGNARAAAEHYSQLASEKSKLEEQLLPIEEQVKALEARIATTEGELRISADDLGRLKQQLEDQKLPDAEEIESGRVRLKGYAEKIGAQERQLSALQLWLAELNKSLEVVDGRVRASVDGLSSHRAVLSEQLALMKKVQIASDAMKSTINGIGQVNGDEALRTRSDDAQAATSISAQVTEEDQELQRQAMAEVNTSQSRLAKTIAELDNRLGRLSELEDKLQASGNQREQSKSALKQRLVAIADQERRFAKLQKRQQALLGRFDALRQARSESVKRASQVLQQTSLLQDRLPALESQLSGGSLGEQAQNSLALIRSRAAPGQLEQWKLQLAGIDKQLGEFSRLLQSRRPKPAPLPVRAPPRPETSLQDQMAATIRAPVPKPDTIPAAAAVKPPNNTPVVVPVKADARPTKPPVVEPVKAEATPGKPPVVEPAKAEATPGKPPVVEPAKAEATPSEPAVVESVKAEAKPSKPPVAELAKAEAQPSTPPVVVPVKADAKPTKPSAAELPKKEATQNKTANSASGVGCNPSRPSCRRWLFLRKKRLERENGTSNASSGSVTE